MNDTHLKTLAQVEKFLNGTQAATFVPLSTEACYEWIAGTLKRFKYFKLRKRDKTTVRYYLLKMTGYSRQQLTRLIEQYRKHQWIGKSSKRRCKFPSKYTREDILLLAQTDECHEMLSGPATKKLFERAYHVYGETEYARLATISVAHIYNLRQSQTYQQKRRFFKKTQSVVRAIAERRKPQPEGQPGYLRIDTVHQGDQDGEKGVYYINAVDEITQMEVICAVEKISEQYLIPVLEQIIATFPFKIKAIHADNGSEYINHTVANLLKKLWIEFTKSRARHSNDNALAESKNGSIVRKHLGYIHIPQKHAERINIFLQHYLTPYINYHRPCYFAKIKIDEKGKQKKTYPYDHMMTPYEKLKSLPDAKQYLKSGINFEDLDEAVNAVTDLESAKKMHEAKLALFKDIFDEGKL